MNSYLFLMSLVVGVGGPAIAIRYLRPILVKIMQSLCDTDGGAEFWIRCAYLLAICGTLIMVLMFGDFDYDATAVSAIRRALLLVCMGVFATVAIISQNIWQQVQKMLAQQAAKPAQFAAPQTAG